MYFEKITAADVPTGGNGYVARLLDAFNRKGVVFERNQNGVLRLTGPGGNEVLCTAIGLPFISERDFQQRTHGEKK